MRFCLLLALGALAMPAETVRGKLTQREGRPAAVEAAEHKLVTLDGDEATRGVLQDKRLNGFDLEAKGRFTTPDRFLVDPIHTHAIMVRKEGKVKLVSYWCETCSIRTYTPGLCWCCQKETTLELRDPDEK